MKTVIIALLLAVVARADLAHPYTAKWYMANSAHAFRLEVDSEGIETTVTDTSDENQMPLFCAGMLEGIWEAVGIKHPDRAIALGPIYQLNAIVVRWLTAHPEWVDEQHRAAAAIFDAPTEAVATPCLGWFGKYHLPKAPKQ